jgi:hypothetical protein
MVTFLFCFKTSTMTSGSALKTLQVEQNIVTARNMERGKKIQRQTFSASILETLARSAREYINSACSIKFKRAQIIIQTVDAFELVLDRSTTRMMCA